MNKKMQNTEEIDMLLAKFYAGELSDAELKHLMECFQSMEAIPLRWQADAVLIRALAVQAYCSATQKDAEAMLDRWEKAGHDAHKADKKHAYAKPVKYVYSAAAALALLFTVGIAMYRYSILKNEAPENSHQYANTEGIKIYCSDGCDDGYIMKLFEECVVA